MGLSEVRSGKRKWGLWCHRDETPVQREVGFIIKNRIKHLVHQIIGVYERIIVLTIKMKRTKTTLIQVYAPTENSSDTELVNFYELLETMLHKYKSQRTIVMGMARARRNINRRTLWIW